MLDKYIAYAEYHERIARNTRLQITKLAELAARHDRIAQDYRDDVLLARLKDKQDPDDFERPMGVK